ncbi:hypothetical protein JCM16358_21100 [Halanaerocella petrolearia]
MFKIDKKEDAIVLVLIILIVGTSSFLILKDKSYGDEAVKVKKQNNNNKLKKENSHMKAGQSDNNTEKIFVHIGGAVSNPGVYKCKKSARLYRVLKKADGPTDQADLNAINLALPVRDGSKIIIPTKGQTEKKGSDKININQANKKELQQLSGVGPATAESIISYRQQQNGFSSLDELTKVSGIGTKTLAKLRGQISY